MALSLALTVRGSQLILGERARLMGLIINQNSTESQGGVQTLTRQKVKTKRPSMYRVILLNDDFTPMDFVVHVLKQFFGQTHDEAHRIMLEVHHKGRGTAGIYPFSVAETKVYLVKEFSRSHQHPLECTMEPEDQAGEGAP